MLSLRTGLRVGGIHQPPMVLNQLLFTPSVSTAGKDCDGNALVEHSGLVSSNPGYVRGLPQTASQLAGSSEPTNRTGVYNAPRSSSFGFCSSHFKLTC